MELIPINVCSEEELASVHYVGEKTLAVILQRRLSTQGQLTPESLNDLLTLRKIDLHTVFDFTPAHLFDQYSEDALKGELEDPGNVDKQDATSTQTKSLDSKADSAGTQTEFSDERSDPTSSSTQTESLNPQKGRAGPPIIPYPYETFPPPVQRKHMNPSANPQGQANPDQDRRSNKPRSGNMGRKGGKSQVGGRGSSVWDTEDRITPSIPRTITFDGKGSWAAVYQKFSLYANEAVWSSAQRKKNLCLCLQGKASEIFVALTQRDPDMDIYILVGKLERRFGIRELPETSRIEFQCAKQGSEEDVLEWADRVSHLATLAYAALPDDFVEQQCIMRFCQGCKDKESGLWAMNMRPETLEKAVEFAQWNRQSSLLILGSRSGSKPHMVRQSVLGEDWEDMPNDIRQVAPQREQHAIPGRSYQNAARQDYTPDSRNYNYARQSPRTASSAQGQSQSVNQGRSLPSSLRSNPTPMKSDVKGERLDGIEQKVDHLELRMSEMKSTIDKLSDAVTALSSLIIKSSLGSSPGPRVPRSPARCFRCQQTGHFLKDCPQSSPKTVSFVECVPNVEGLEMGAALLSPP